MFVVNCKAHGKSKTGITVVCTSTLVTKKNLYFVLSLLNFFHELTHICQFFPSKLGQSKADTFYYLLNHLNLSLIFKKTCKTTFSEF